jgi:hypothetical protein
VDHKENAVGGAVSTTLGGAILQILLLDLVFSVDLIITPVGMTDHLAIMYIAVIVVITRDAGGHDPACRLHRAQPHASVPNLKFGVSG